ncbi:NADPH-cytochrome-P450 oxidoreductase [Reticulomyxa filosa]|uniref:NADPH--hemoprotein reductase n=1 Tax=Reticulomyxa filosa TaxID=46433 RepID=X6LJ22_RETFI|nr:NADPH-cytochrome-P450 oxidoreductase [Reticulomyxa filosa]|eukprot:ETO01351.1 NADPH-cytochrome-P450 oxidoreductase [Reticulomyxa filosa]
MFGVILTGALIVASTLVLYNLLFKGGSESDDNRPNEQQEKKKDDEKETKESEEKEEGFPLKIFFGSQSGTAEGFAYDMQKEAKKYGFGAQVIDLEEYDVEELQDEKLVIFLVATYGEGEPTDNAQEFYQWLTEGEHSENELRQVDFAVFGLGNSQYQFFNEMGKQFDQRLQELGGQRLIDRGIGDDDKGSIDDQFNEWKEKLWPIITMKFLGVSMDQLLTDQPFVSALELFAVRTKQDSKTTDKEEKEETKQSSDSSLPLHRFPIDNDTHWLYGQCALLAKCPLSENELRQIVSDLKENNDAAKNEHIRINTKLLLPSRRYNWLDQVVRSKIADVHEARPSTADGSTLHVEFDITQLNISYKTADNLGIVARNDPDTVDALCNRLRIDPNDVVRIRNKNKEPLTIPIPNIVSVRNLLLWYLDINGPPKKQTLQVLSQFARDGKEKLQLQEMASKGLQNTEGKFWNFANLLNTFPIAQIAITAKMEMQLRDTSDSNEKEAIDFIGVASNYLRQSKKNDIVQIFVQSSSFRMPSPEIPLIMVGAGAGIAPFRGFVQEGNQLIRTFEKGTFGDWWLFFGCRYPDKDYIYKEFLESSLQINGGCLKALKVAFSRQQDKKIYVQDLIKENADALYDMLAHKNAHVFVCGQPSMGKAVRSVFQEILDEKKSHIDINSLLKSGKYVQELW